MSYYPDTQLESWDDLQEKIPEMNQRVLKFLRLRGASALFEISEGLEIPFHTLSGRLTTLRDQGHILDTGDRKVFPLSGKRQIVWARAEERLPVNHIGKFAGWREEALAARKVIDALPPVSFFEPDVKLLLKDYDLKRNRK